MYLANVAGKRHGNDISTAPDSKKSRENTQATGNLAGMSSSTSKSPTSRTQSNDSCNRTSHQHSNEMDPLHQVALSEKTAKYRYYMTYVHRGIDNSYNQGSAITLHSKLS